MLALSASHTLPLRSRGFSSFTHMQFILLEKKKVFLKYFSENSYTSFISFHYHFLKNMSRRIPDLHNCESCPLKFQTRTDQGIPSSSYYSSTTHRSESLPQKLQCKAREKNDGFTKLLIN